MKSNIIKALSLGVMLTAFTACSDDLNKGDYDNNASGIPPVTTTGDVIENLGQQLTISASIAENGSPVKEAGVLVSTNEQISIDADEMIVGKANLVEGQTDLEVVVNGLEVDQDYYYCAYAVSEAGGIALGEVKSVKTIPHQRVDALELDFTDTNILSLFSVVALHGEDGGAPATWENIGPFIGARFYLGMVSSGFDPDILFNYGQGALAGNGAVDNLITYHADFTNLHGVQVSVEVLRLAALFGEDLPTEVEAYVSDAPITNAEELAAATKLGSGICDENSDFVVFNFDVPRAFNKPCYFSLRSASSVRGGDYGIVLTGFGYSSLKPME